MEITTYFQTPCNINSTILMEFAMDAKKAMKEVRSFSSHRSRKVVADAGSPQNIDRYRIDFKMDFIDSWVLKGGGGVNWAVHFRIEQSKLYNNKKLYSFIQKGAVFLGTKVV